MTSSDRIIRIAPTLPLVDEVRKAKDMLCLAIELTCALRLLGRNR